MAGSGGRVVNLTFRSALTTGHPMMSKRALNGVEDGSESRGSKRRKVRSCLTCRKQKARCEFTSSASVCHRCTVLSIPCIFEGDAPISVGTQQACTSRGSQTSARAETRGQTVATNGDPSRQAVRESLVEDRLSTIEEALRQVLRATGLPSLDSISSSINDLRATISTPPSTALLMTPSFDLSPSGPFRPRHDAGYVLPISSTNKPPRRDTRRYLTPVELDYITLAQSTELTAIFEMRYNHCVYTPILKSHRITMERPFTFTAMCALALRLKTTIPNQDIARNQISQLLESHLKTAMGARPYSIDAIHALLLMSLWSSVLLSNNPGQDSFQSPDGWLLLTMAIHMAQSLRLKHSVIEVTSLIQHGKDGSPSYETALEKARVWYTLVTYDLAMSVGPVRPRLIATQDASQAGSLIASFALSPSDQCLAYHLDALILLHRVYQIPPPSGSSQVAEFAIQVENIIQDFEALSNRARDSSLHCGDNRALCAEYRMFRFYEQYCECVCLSKAYEILISPPFDPLVCISDNEDSGEEEEETTTTSGFVFLWMSRACAMAGNVINEIFPPNHNDPAFLSTAPDHMFTIIAFCAVTLIQSQMTSLKWRPEGLHRAKEFDELVERASKSLARLALPDSQLPRRYADVLSTMLRNLKKQKNEKGSRILEQLQRQETNGSAPTNGTSHNGQANSGNLLALAVALTQEEGDTFVPTNDPMECVIPSITDTSSFLDPATWLQDPTLDWDHYFTGDHAQLATYRD